jgi:hypothetical protein
MRHDRPSVDDARRPRGHRGAVRAAHLCGESEASEMKEVFIVSIVLVLIVLIALGVI